MYLLTRLDKVSLLKFNQKITLTQAFTKCIYRSVRAQTTLSILNEDVLILIFNIFNIRFIKKIKTSQFFKPRSLY